MGAAAAPPLGEVWTRAALEFTPFPKISRWNRDVVVTEKLDGTNAAVIVTEDGLVAAQSRKRLISPGDDNFGFATWVRDHENELRDGLGAGVHFGEWWGHGIQRGYGLEEKRFSLFNTKRWTWDGGAAYRCLECACCHVVPVLETAGVPSDLLLARALMRLADGSAAAPRFMRPEGIVIFHAAANTMFKVTLEGDEKPKGERP